MAQTDPLLLLDNGTLAYIIGNGDYRFTNIKFGQDAIALKLYITPTGTQPIVLGDDGQQAKKIKNMYIYCQHVVRLK